MSDLDALTNQASAADAVGQVDPGQDAPGSTNEPPAGPNYEAEAAMMVAGFATMIAGFSETAGALWDESTRARVAATLAPVLLKYNFTMGGMPVELVLALTAGPVLWQTSRIIAANLAKKKQLAKPAKPEAVATTDPADPAAPGAPAVHPQMALYK